MERPKIRQLAARDREAISEIVSATGMFSEEEISVAKELVEAALSKPERGDYLIHCAVDAEDRPAGYVCFGKVPLTQASYDLYWIVVHPRWQGRKVGSMLLEFAEAEVRKLGGRMILAETSSKPLYEPTRAFYLRNGFRAVSFIEDFYAPGDGRIIYLKKIG